MKKLLKKIILTLWISVLIFSCAKITDEPFDTNPVSTVTVDSIFVRQYVNSIYNFVPRGYNRLGNSMLDASTDLAVNNTAGSPAFRIGTGSWGASDNPDDAWANNYQGIRSVNIFMNEIVPQITDRVISDQEYLNRLVGQAYFLRALFYSELFKRYGGVPIVEEVFEAGQNVNVIRSTYEETMEYIVEQAEKAAELLPVAYGSSNATDFGRATKGAAYALQSRVLLYAASPLFNNPSNTTHEPWTGAYDPQKWSRAASAAHKVIQLDEYALFPQYFRFFTLLESDNREMIFNHMAVPNNNVERINGPTGITGGGGATGPSLNLVNAYRMSDGTPFDWNNPEHAANPFENRENRFAGSILWNGREWMEHTVETFQGGSDMQSVNSTKTGFYMRKFKDANARWFGGNTGVANHSWPIIRYAEVLLNYAEAMNEAYGPYNDPQGYGMTAADALGLIRQRGNLNPWEVPQGLSQDQMRELVHLERKIELALEEHRPFDLRRWRKAMDVLNQPVMGLRILKNDDGTFTYTPVEVESRVFTERMHLYPIPQREIDKNSSIIQNPGW